MLKQWLADPAIYQAVDTIGWGVFLAVVIWGVYRRVTAHWWLTQWRANRRINRVKPLPPKQPAGWIGL